MRKCNFRVKVDLSKFYEDVRRSSWVYVDTDVITCVCHLQKHITKIFDIRSDFHLLLNTGEYIPPNEDARILKEDETILVIPGTGLEKSNSNDSQSLIPQQKPSASRSFVPAKVEQAESSDEEDQVSVSMETTGENTAFLSVINDSQLQTNEKSESKADKSLNNSEATLPESETSPIKNKRKRVRRKRKSKTDVAVERDQSVVPRADYKKPKIIDSFTIPNGKHIRFGDVEKLEFHGYESSLSNSNDSKKSDLQASRNGTPETSYWDKPAVGSSASLSNLLALRQSSTPITFSSKKIGQQFSTGSNKETKDFTARENGTEIRQTSEKDTQGLIVDQKKHSIMENKARVNDVMAFKTLKMGNDYTPQVSEYITAHVIDIMSDKTTYVFKILGGMSEIQAPQGKFDLETEETGNTRDTDVITLSWSQLIEPRLIYRE